MRWGRSAIGTLGVDIGAHGVTLAAVRHTAKGPRLDAALRAEVPRDAMHGHVVRDQGAVADVVRGLAAAARRWPAIVALPAAAVMMRRLTVAADPGAPLDAAVVREAVPLVPDGLDDVVLDYAVLDRDATAARVVVVATRSELVRSYTATLRAAGLDPWHVDVDVLALHRVRRACGGVDGAALVHVAARTVSVALVRDGLPELAGDVPAPTGVDVDALAATVTRLLAGPEPHPAAERPVAVLSGAPSRIDGFAAALARQGRCAIETLDPFAAFARADRPRHGEPAAFAVAVGLALRCPERPWW